MAEKKRKVSAATIDPATKKAKKNTKTSDVSTAPTDIAQPVKSETKSAEIPSGASKKNRKRAADFLDDEPEATPPKKGKKEVGGTKVEPASLTADGANGIIENSEDEGVTITTTKQSKKRSMMAEAERTQDQELADEFAPAKESSEDEEDIESAPALLRGFDSDNDDPAEDKDFDPTRVQPIPQFKKTSKKLRQAKEKKSDGPGVVYVGRIPHGFYESQMKEYFSQFGDISRLRLSRNKKTGASKHFAFIEFQSDEVAKIVAETMDNYLMFGHILKCKYAPEGTLHNDVWKGANKKFRHIPHHKLLRQKAEAPKTEEQIAKKMRKEQSKRQMKQHKMLELGYEYELPELKKSAAHESAAIEEPKLEDKIEGALVPPTNVPKDEVAAKIEEDMKKAKKPKRSKDALPVVNEAVSELESKAPQKSKVRKGEIHAAEPTSSKGLLDEHKSKVKKQKLQADTAQTRSAPKKDGKQLKSILKKPKGV